MGPCKFKAKSEKLKSETKNLKVLKVSTFEFWFLPSSLNFLAKKYFVLLLLSFLILDLSEYVLAENQLEEEVLYDPGEAVYALSLEQVSQLAVENNFDIQMAQYDALIARTDQDKAESIFDTILNAGITYNDDQSARTNTFGGTVSKENAYSFGASKKLPTGTTIDLDFSNTRNWSNSSFSTLNPSHDSAAGITVNQELGKNFFGIQDRGDIKITALDIENSEFTSLEKIETSIADVQKAYWDLVLARERIEIAQRMAEQARKLYDLHLEKIEVGLVEEPELLAAEANYRTRTNELLILEHDAKTKANVLRFLLNISNDEIIIDPVDQFLIHEEIYQMESSLRTALENRQDYKRARNDIESKDIKLVMKKHNLWPEINLEASLAQNGVGPHFSEAVGNISEEDNPNFSAGLSISFPLENREARAELKEAELEKAKVLVNLKRVERKIAIDIMDQVRSCNVLKESAYNRDRIAKLQDEKLAKETKRFNRGRSDTDTLVRFQEDLIQAELLAAQAKFRYYTAIIDLKVKEGSLLEKYWNEI